MARRYYQLLRISRTASADEVKRAYREQARAYHPDQNPGDPACEEQFKAIVEAYRVLSDDALRRNYDRYGLAPAGAAFHDPPVALRTEVGSVIRNVARAASRRFRARRGGDIRMKVTLPFNAAVLGTTRVFELPRAASDGHVEARRLAFELPPGLNDGQVLRWPGEGEPGAHGGRPGDLYVDLHVTAHPILRRNGLDIVCKLPLSLLELAEGAEVTVPTVWGPKRLNVPAGTRPGDELRLPERGVPGPVPGDAVLVVEVFIPPLDTEGVRAALQSVYAEHSRPAAFDACLLECRGWRS